MVTQSQKDDLLARIVKAQSVGATILSNMTAAKKIAEALPVEPGTAPVASFALTGNTTQEGT